MPVDVFELVVAERQPAQAGHGGELATLQASAQLVVRRVQLAQGGKWWRWLVGSAAVAAAADLSITGSQVGERQVGQLVVRQVERGEARDEAEGASLVARRRRHAPLVE